MKWWFSWIAVGLLAALCAVVAVLQYRWIGEISSAERQRLEEQLRDELAAFRNAFTNEIRNSATALETNSAEVERQGREGAYAARYREWQRTHGPLFRRIAIAVPQDDDLELKQLDFTSGRFSSVSWPDDWSGLRSHLRSRLAGSMGPPPGPRPEGGPPQGHLPQRPAPPPRPGPNEHHGQPGPPLTEGDGAFEIPRFGSGPREGSREQEWLIVEPDLKYVSNTIVPELLNRFLAHSGRMDYDATVSTPEGVIFESAAGASARIGEKSDGSVRLWGASPGSGPRPGPGFHGSPGPREPDGGRMDRGGGAGLDWTLRVRHKAGSLEALVEQARQRNLALSAGLLLLIVATVAALVRFSRQAQRLAELQMHFVAGVSHELRTPLTVIRTAAYNLRGRLAERPEQVERYGQLIEGESKKLDALVEQVLQFASARAGLAIRHLEPVAVEELIDKALEPSAAARRQAGVTLEKRIAADLPPVLADGLALRHALQNLIDNALKYGADTGKWIGVSASSARNGSGPAVEICIADRGPGIPPEEQQQIFDPFFRGRRAVSDQIHGTGLGLDLVKRIVDAHGGTVQVKSAAGKPTEFVLRIPAA